MDINGTGKIVEQFGPFERAKIGAAADFVCVKYAVGFVAHLIEQVIFKDELDLGVFIGAQRRTVRENVVEAAFPVDGVCAFGSALAQQMVMCSSFSSSSHSVRRNGARRPASTRRPASANVVQGDVGVTSFCKVWKILLTV